MKRMTTNDPKEKNDKILNFARKEGDKLILHLIDRPPIDIEDILRPCSENCAEKKNGMMGCGSCVNDGSECVVALLFACALQGAGLREALMTIEDAAERRMRDGEVH